MLRPERIPRPGGARLPKATRRFPSRPTINQMGQMDFHSNELLKMNRCRRRDKRWQGEGQFVSMLSFGWAKRVSEGSPLTMHNGYAGIRSLYAHFIDAYCRLPDLSP